MTQTPTKTPRVIYNQNNRLTNFLKEKEGFRSEPYLDQAGLPTIGYGTRFYEDGTEVTMDDPCLLYTSPSPRDRGCSRMPSSA